MSLALFETYSVSDEDSKDSRLHPAISKQSVPFLMDRITKRFEKEGYSLKERNEDYQELLLVDESYSLTFHFLKEEGAKVKIGVSVYAPSKRGKTRNKLMESLAILKNLVEENKTYSR